MAMRRPRIKAVANIQLNVKRKPKPINDVKLTNIERTCSDGIKEYPKLNNIQINEEELQNIEEPMKGQHDQEVRMKITSDTKPNEGNINNHIVEEGDCVEDEIQKKGKKISITAKKEETNLKDVVEDVRDSFNDSDAFKCPPKVGYQRTISHTSNSGADDVFYSDIEENALQMDLQKSPNGFPMSPSKNQTRQRIRPTPHFGQRRNSFVGSSPSHNAGQDDSSTNNTNNEFVHPNQMPRRERHHSASLSGNSSSTLPHYHHTPHKYLPTGIGNGGMGRIRTESGCSVYSDTNTSSHKSRKTDEHNHRQHSRREFEARFVNGVPDKSALKMSDLIYWNPAANPMEQKPNPNVKLEGLDSSPSNEAKPFVEKKEKDSDAPAAATAEAEAVPVPQLKLNSNGELILDDKSLVIETTAEQEARKVLANSSLIYLDENTGMNGFYSRQKRTREWPSSETIKFYRCLQNVGTDFSLMVSLFPNRTRRDLKLKFKKEEKINGHLINKALLYPKQFDIETLKQQVEEEEKAREEEAKKFKIAKEKTKERKKELKKKGICSTSVAHRVLSSSHDIYQNENTQKPKRSKKINPNKKRAANTETTYQPPEEVNGEETDNLYQSNKNENIINKNIKIEEGVKIKRRRRRAPNINTQKEEIIIIKEEIIKSENKPETNSLFITTGPPADYNDVKQLETEMDELLQNNNETLDDTEQSYMAITEEVEQIGEANEEEDESSITTDSSHFVIDDNTYYDDENMDTDNYESHTFYNLNDSSVNTCNEVATEQTYISSPSPLISSSSFLPPPRSLPEPFETQTSLLLAPPPSSPDVNNIETCSSMLSERELNEQDIQLILTELAEGTLVLVSTLDPDDPDKVLNEIYMVDKNTGDLCDEPLNIPDNIVQCILSVMS